MDRLASIALFLRIVERGSFTAAAASCGVSRPAATAAIQALETRLGTRLLQRSTRHVRPTQDGQLYYDRCLSALGALEEADRAIGKALTGTIRLDTIGHLARTVILPALPGFLARHPGLVVHLGEGERLIDLLREGVDCVIRGGPVPDSDMIARPLGVLPEITVASPDYLARYGVPATPDDLDGHVMIGFASSRTKQILPLEFTRAGDVLEYALPARLVVSGAESCAAAARLGFGLAQAPRYRFEDDIAAGRLVEVLRDFPPLPTPLTLLYPSNRQLAPRVRIFMDWLIEIFAPLTEAGRADPGR
ncbi:LysR family transcriptional regulator [Swaminathania salitolerans]|uniref:LysR family transcriptional regulator n=1 Tax=Swaminathania salitolerans TaxID=182838 RepID=A0A511BMH9_9PROT|nr:LysR family transcriptional regulator [Swaminathania salitolerans]GBQ15894.1 LysR family transcriptional regulator [Swaminathania salitolerans LMG 21291]GEL01527.1 LysR family transcriptional regulator [Swaminathania salitolerans]